MSTIINTLLYEYTRLNFEPIDLFIQRLNTTTNLSDISKLKSNLGSLQENIALDVKVNFPVSGGSRYITEETMVMIDWNTNHHKDNTINVDLSVGERRWSSKWGLSNSLDFVRSVEFCLSAKRLPEMITLYEKPHQIALDNYNWTTPVLCFSAPYEMRIDDPCSIAYFLSGFSLDTRRTLVDVRIDELHSNHQGTANFGK